MADLNWIAVIVGTVVSFLVGWAWYSPKLFGKGWSEGVGVDLDKIENMPVLAMVSQLVGLLLLALLIGLTATANMLGAAVIGILAVAALVVSNGAFAQHSNYALAVQGGYIVVVGVIMIAVQAIF